VFNYEQMRSITIFIFILMSQLIISQNEKPEKLYNKAYQFITNGNYNESIELLTKAIEIDSLGRCGTGINGKAQNELGYAYMRIQNFKLGRKFFDESINLNPRNPDPRINKVASYILQSNIKKAKAELLILIHEIPGYPLAHWQYGNLLENEGKIKEALMEYRKARAFNRKLNILPNNIVKEINQKLEEN